MAGWSVPGVVHLKVVREDSVGRRVLARRRVTRKSLAITYLSPELLADTELRARFADECARLAPVRRASLARVHRFVECDHDAAVISDHVDGTPLRSLLQAHGAVGTEAALVLLKDVLLALAGCHEVGVSHGDVKPENVILTAAGRVRLVDVGLWSASGRRQLARSTPFYLAPEQWSDPSASPAGDVYAATVTFFECLVGAPPFYADGVAELSAKHQGSVPPAEVVAEPLQELVLRGLAKDPGGRPEARNVVASVNDVAFRTLAAGWERRGRQELAALLANRGSLPDLPAPCRRPSWVGYGKPVRLAAVMGGALALAAGLSSPPLAVIPGVDIFGSGGRPPVLAFPEPDRGAAAMRVVTNSPLAEHGSIPAAKVKAARPVTGLPLPAPSIPEPRTHGLPYDHAASDARHPDASRVQGTTPDQSTPAPQACAQLLGDHHKSCTALNPEQSTPGSVASPSDPSEVSIPVALPIQLPAPVDLPVQLPAPVQSPVGLPLLAQPPRSQDIRIPKSFQPQTDSQLLEKRVRIDRSDTAGNSVDRLTGRSQKGFGVSKNSGNWGNR